MTTHQPRDASGRWQAVPRADTLNRYLTDPAFRARMDAERATEQRRLNHERDLADLARIDPDCGAACAIRERVGEYLAHVGRK